MVPNLLFYQPRLITLVLLCLIIHAWWPDEPSPTPQTPLKSDKPRCKRSKAPKPFTGLIQKQICDVYEQSVDARLMPPARHIFSSASPEDVGAPSTSKLNFCPEPNSSYHGWLGR